MRVGGDDWSALPVAVRDGVAVRLSDVATISAAEGPAEILHLDGRRAIVVRAQGLEDTPANDVRAALARALPGATIARTDLGALEAEPWGR